jgi:hypothetical protein
MDSKSCGLLATGFSSGFRQFKKKKKIKGQNRVYNDYYVFGFEKKA